MRVLGQSRLLSSKQVLTVLVINKFRVYPTKQYCTGMQSGVTFGDLADWAMTFQMNNDDDRGFWWGDDGHNTSQGAMSLSTRGWLSVAERILVGAGQSSTGGASYPLDVRGKTRLYESTGSSPSTTEGTLILQHGNGGGTSSIVFPSAANKGSDYGYISYSDDIGASGERARLRIGTSNDGDDHICLLPSGNIGISIDFPEDKLHVTGNIKASGRVTANDADVKTILTNGYSYVKYGFHGMLNNLWKRLVGVQFTGMIVFSPSSNDHSAAVFHVA
mmetsp:Transcript_7524/g.31323  ORF Transcript_7524/g.31323 Transcript_7524/m.31323 type:complete len:275 (+) Transcript_7524:580-1404(+)